MRVADVGCGVGGPLLAIAEATGASITGLNNNAHQETWLVDRDVPWKMYFLDDAGLRI